MFAFSLGDKELVAGGAGLALSTVMLALGILYAVLVCVFYSFVPWRV